MFVCLVLNLLASEEKGREEKGEMTEVKKELTPEEEKLTIRDISIAAEAQTKQGDTFYLITQRYILIYQFTMYSRV